MKNGSIHLKFWRLYLICMLMPLIILAILLTNHFNVNLKQRYSREIENTLRTAAFNIESLLDEMKQDTLSWVNNPDMVSFYTIVEANDGVIPEQPMQLDVNYTVACWNVLSTSSSNVKRVGFYPATNSRGRYYQVERWSDLKYYDGYNLEENEWYSKVLNSRGRAFFIPDRSESPSNDSDAAEVVSSFSVLRLAFNTDSRHPYGIIKIDASPKYLDNLFSPLITGKNSGIMLLDENGESIYSTNGELEEMIRMMPNGGELQCRNLDYSIFVEGISGTSWHLVYLYSKQDMALSIRPLIMWIPVVVLLAVMFSAMAFSISSRKFTGPVKNILNTLRATEEGDLNARVPILPNASDEITSIAREYNHMLDMLNARIDSEYKARIHQQTAEYSALQAQINPHFLYNTLNGFITLNQIGARKELEDSIHQMTELFRYTSRRQHESTVREEIDFVRHYLSLQRLRFSERLEFDIFLDERTADFRIPRMLVQPLVENAIVHGLEPLDRLVHISIRAELKTVDDIEMLALSVTDDGAGVCMEDFKAKQNHTGLLNVQGRIKHCSKEARFTFESAPDQGAASAIYLPVGAVNIGIRKEGEIL